MMEETTSGSTTTMFKSCLISSKFFEPWKYVRCEASEVLLNTLTLANVSFNINFETSYIDENYSITMLICCVQKGIENIVCMVINGNDIKDMTKVCPEGSIVHTETNLAPWYELVPNGLNCITISFAEDMIYPNGTKIPFVVSGSMQKRRIGITSILEVPPKIFMRASYISEVQFSNVDVTLINPDFTFTSNEVSIFFATFNNFTTFVVDTVMMFLFDFKVVGIKARHVIFNDFVASNIKLYDDYIDFDEEIVYFNCETIEIILSEMFPKYITLELYGSLSGKLKIDGSFYEYPLILCGNYSGQAPLIEVQNLVINTDILASNLRISASFVLVSQKYVKGSSLSIHTLTEFASTGNNSIMEFDEITIEADGQLNARNVSISADSVVVRSSKGLTYEINNFKHIKVEKDSNSYINALNVSRNISIDVYFSLASVPRMVVLSKEMPIAHVVMNNNGNGDDLYYLDSIGHASAEIICENDLDCNNWTSEWVSKNNLWAFTNPTRLFELECSPSIVNPNFICYTMVPIRKEILDQDTPSSHGNISLSFYVILIGFIIIIIIATTWSTIRCYQHRSKKKIDSFLSQSLIESNDNFDF